MQTLIPKYGANPIDTLVHSLGNRLRLDPALVRLAGKVVNLARPEKVKAKLKPRKTIEHAVASVETR